MKKIYFVICFGEKVEDLIKTWRLASNLPQNETLKVSDLSVVITGGASKHDEIKFFLESDMSFIKKALEEDYVVRVYVANFLKISAIAQRIEASNLISFVKEKTKVYDSLTLISSEEVDLTKF